MNNYLLYAGVLSILLGVVHSILGEVLVFKKLRNKHNNSWVTDISELPVRSIRIIWASWHVVTLFGIAIGVILLKFDQVTSEQQTVVELIKLPLFIALFLSALIVIVGTKGKHPGGLVLLIISGLVWLA